MDDDIRLKLAKIEQELQEIKQVVRHASQHELGGFDEVRLSVQDNGAQLPRQRTINFTGLTVTNDSANRRINVSAQSLKGSISASGRVTGVTGLYTTASGRLWLERPISGGTRAWYTDIDANGHLGLYRATDGVYAGTQANFLTDGSTRFSGSVGVNDGNRFILDVNSGNDTYIRKNGGTIEFVIDGTRRGYIDNTGWHNG